VLDEADRMLDMGFQPDVEKALALTASREQTVLVSATLPRDVQRLAREHMRADAEHVRVGAAAIPTTLEHHRLNVLDGQKEDALVALLKKEQPERAIVFVRTRERAAAFAKLLKSEGILADALQGDMSHDQRRHVFDLFARGTTRVLVATDLASRGLDVPEMQLVVNADLPDEDEQYLHRAGRAARQDRPGRVVTLVLPDEKPARLRLERLSGSEWAPYKVDIAKRGTDAAHRAAEPGSSRFPPAKGKPPRNEAGRRGAKR